MLQAFIGPVLKEKRLKSIKTIYHPVLGVTCYKSNALHNNITFIGNE